MTRILRSPLGNLMMASVKEKTFTDLSRVLFSDDFKEELSIKLKKQLQFEGKKRAVLANLNPLIVIFLSNELENAKIISYNKRFL